MAGLTSGDQENQENRTDLCTQPNARSANREPVLEGFPLQKGREYEKQNLSVLLLYRRVAWRSAGATSGSGLASTCFALAGTTKRAPSLDGASWLAGRDFSDDSSDHGGNDVGDYGRTGH